MKYSESKPFSSGMDYEFFLENWCEKCTHFKLHNGLFPEYPEDGGCPVLDAIEIAKIDLSKFPSKDVIEERDEDGNVLYWHKCTKFKRRKANGQKENG